MVKTERPNNTGALALAERGGPFTPAEFAMLETLDPAARNAMRYRTVAPTRSPDEIEDGARIEAAFGTRRAAAEADLAAAIATRETATEAMFNAKDRLAAASAVTWISGNTWGPSYERAATPDQRESAEQQLAEAESEYRRARQIEEAAREKLSTIGAAVNALARELAAARSRK